MSLSNDQRQHILLSAQQATLRSFGLGKEAEEDIANVSRGRIPFKPLDPAMQRQRDAVGVNMAFDDNAEIDPTNPNPEPTMVYRADDPQKDKFASLLRRSLGLR
jgi:hypothetical protein